jgi:hypothetical protein
MLSKTMGLPVKGVAHAFNCGTVIAGSVASAFYSLFGMYGRDGCNMTLKLKKNKVLNYQQRTAL